MRIKSTKALVNAQLSRIKDSPVRPFEEKAPGLILPENSINIIPEDGHKRAEVAEWAIDDLFPALIKFGKAGCKDFQDLTSAARLSPHKPKTLKERFQRSQTDMDRILLENNATEVSPAYPQFITDYISNHHLSNCGLWITNHDSGSDHAEQLSSVSLNSATHWWKQNVGRFSTKGIALRTIKEGGVIGSGMVHPMSHTVILNLDELKQEASSPWEAEQSGCKGEVYEIIRDRYSSSVEFYPYLFASVYGEELRHFLDFKIENSKPENNRPYISSESKLDFIKGAVKHEELRKIGLQPLTKPSDVDEPRTLAIRMGVFELSGQLAAGIPEPLVPIKTWASSFDNMKFGTDHPHPMISMRSNAYSYSGLLAMRLLGEEFGFLDKGFTRENWLGISQSFTQLPKAIGKKTPQELRLAIKAVMNRCFVTPIDINPFPEIQTDGSI